MSATPETLTMMAVEAIGFALTGSPVEARATVDALVVMADHHPHRLRDVAKAWIDSAAVERGWEPGTVLDLDVTNQETGSSIQIDDAAPSIVWASRIIAARVARDDDQVQALAYTLVNESDAAGYLATLLDLLAVTLHVARGAVSPAWQSRAAGARANAELN